MSHQPTDKDEIQRRTALLIRGLDTPAPASLHETVRAMAERSAVKRTRRPVSLRRGPALAPGRPVALLAGACASMAVLLAALVLIVGTGGGTAAPSVLQAAALGLRLPTSAAPEESPSAPGQLAISAEGIAYPYWNRRFGWQTAGARSDRLGGRTVTTVFYANAAGSRIGYSIVGGRALDLPAGGHPAVWHGTRFDVLQPNGSTVVTWRRDGHTCILVGARVSAKTLLTLANWQTA